VGKRALSDARQVCRENDHENCSGLRQKVSLTAGNYGPFQALTRKMGLGLGFKY